MAEINDVSEKVSVPIDIQICYASMQKTTIIQLTTTSNSTVRDAIDLSQILTKHPEVDLGVCKVGIFGRLKTLRDVVQQGDRIEIYRPLTADPMEARRRRFARQLRMKPGP